VSVNHFNIDVSIVNYNLFKIVL